MKRWPLRRSARAGVAVGVVDMPSIDEGMLMQLSASGKLLVLAEQNNGYILQNLLKVLCHNRTPDPPFRRMIAINTLTPEGKPQFIHSGMYEELIEAFGLAPRQLAARILEATHERTPTT